MKLLNKSKCLSQEFAIYDTDVHVEPAAIPEDEIFTNVLRKLHKNEKLILSKIPGYESLLAEEFYLIDANGNHLTHSEMVLRNQNTHNDFNSFKMVSVSQKTKLVTYEMDNNLHTSIWRRKEEWFLIFHQITPKSKEE